MSGDKNRVRLGRNGPRAPLTLILREGRSEYLEAIRWIEIQAAERRGDTIIKNQAKEIADAARRGAMCPLSNNPLTFGSDYEAGRNVRSVLPDLRARANHMAPDDEAVESWAIQHNLGEDWAIEAIRETLKLWAKSPTSMTQLVWSRHTRRQLARSYECLEPPHAEDYPSLDLYLTAAMEYYKATRARQGKAGWKFTIERDLASYQWLAEYQVFGLDYHTIAGAREESGESVYEGDKYRKGIKSRALDIGVTLRKPKRKRRP